MHKGHRTLIKFLLLELRTLDLLRKFALYIWLSRVFVSATSTVLKIMILFVLRFYGPVNPLGSCRA